MYIDHPMGWEGKVEWNKKHHYSVHFRHKIPMQMPECRVSGLTRSYLHLCFVALSTILKQNYRDLRL